MARLGYQLIDRNGVWYGLYNDGSGRRNAKGRIILKKVRCGTSKSRAAGIMRELVAASDRVRAGTVSPDEQRYTQMALQPIADHVEWLTGAMKDKGVVSDYIDNAVYRIGRVNELAGIERLSDVTLPAVERGVKAAKTADDLSDKTAWHYWGAYRTFLNYLVRDRRLKDNPMKGHRPEKVKTLAHPRRALTEAEIDAICLGAIARRGGKRSRFSGVQRTVFYRMMLAMGLRKSEAMEAALHPEWFKLEGERPVLFLPATLTKDRNDTLQPMSVSAAETLRTWIRMRNAEGKRTLFDVTPGMRLSVTFKHDRKAGGVAYRSGDGIADLHSLRHTAITKWANAPGAKLQNVQKLARHKDIKTTMGYVHTDDQDIQDFLNGMG